MLQRDWLADEQLYGVYVSLGDGLHLGELVPRLNLDLVIYARRTRNTGSVLGTRTTGTWIVHYGGVHHQE
jgi:hypothetical protein